MKYKCIWVAFFSVIMIGTSLQATSQVNNDAAIAVADTSAFSINSQDGWQLYNSYSALVTADSVQLEIIVQHDNNVNWNINNYIGKITNTSYYPQNDRLVSFNLISTVYELTVDKEGKCFLRLVSGNLSSLNSVIIPIRFFYKK